MQLASKVLERAGADTGKSIMITFAEKVQLLNSLLASTAPLDTDMYAAATIGVKNALKDAHAASLGCNAPAIRAFLGHTHSKRPLRPSRRAQAHEQGKLGKIGRL